MIYNISLKQWSLCHLTYLLVSMRSLNKLIFKAAGIIGYVGKLKKKKKMTWRVNRDIKIRMLDKNQHMNYTKTCPSVTFHFMKNQFSDISGKWILPNMIRTVNRLHSLYWSIHTKDESKRDFVFAFIFGVNWPVQWM